MDRLYMAKAMSPVFTKLMNMVLALRPESVEQYLIGCLNDMKVRNCEEYGNRIRYLITLVAPI